MLSPCEIITPTLLLLPSSFCNCFSFCFSFSIYCVSSFFLIPSFCISSSSSIYFRVFSSFFFFCFWLLRLCLCSSSCSSMFVFILLVGYMFVFFFCCNEECKRESMSESENRGAWWRATTRIRECDEERETRIKSENNFEWHALVRIRVKLVISHNDDMNKRLFLICFLIFGHVSFEPLK